MSEKERKRKVEQMNGKRNRRDEPPLIPIFRFHFSSREHSFPRITPTYIYIYLYYIFLCTRGFRKFDFSIPFYFLSTKGRNSFSMIPLIFRPYTDNIIWKGSRRGRVGGVEKEILGEGGKRRWRRRAFVVESSEKTSTKYYTRVKITAQYCSRELLDILTEHLVDVRPHENECAALLASACAMKSKLFRASFCIDRCPPVPVRSSETELKRWLHY